ncbi:MAG: DUF1573 domain-containing protein [Bacteroidetes bacterium]|jgi:hypothetical protein|nr:DUF1573 domain-containing protein [Bacteroidota bacterium]
MRRSALTLGILTSLTLAMAAYVALGPQITFTKTTHDFGKIPQGKPVSYEFEFTNTGDAPLVLTSVKASCGCTTPFYPTEPVQPGQTNKIKAVYNAASPGTFHKSVTVTTNIKEATGEEKKVILFIKGDVAADAFNNGGEKPGSPVRITK